MVIQIPQQGWGQQTPAAQTIIRGAFGAAKAIRSGIRSLRSSKRKKRSKGAAGKKRKTRASGSGKRSRRSTSSRLVKGSAAAKAYMAKIRAKRK